MTPTWLIEAGVYGREIEPLLAVVARQGMDYQLLRHSALVKGPAPQLGDCVIAYGTFPFVRQVQLHFPWKPGAWCDPANLDCAAYFAHFGKFLLNQPYALLPGVEAIRLRDWLYDTLGKDDEVFARPSGCNKLFVGRCLYRDDFADALSPARFDPATLVVIAPPRDLGREWRLVVSGEQVLAASLYADAGRATVEAGCPEEVSGFAQAVLAEVSWRPDPIFMLDVCECDGQLWLLEVNGFSTSWMYGCDPEPVVRAAAELAVRACEQGQGPASEPG